MIWILLLCHFAADYPLQTDAMVKAKKHFPGLIAHVMVHFVTMLFVMVGILHMKFALVFSGIFILTSCHFAIDTWKNILSNRQPDWVIFTYLQDQILHITSIWLVASLLNPNAETLTNIPELLWIIPAVCMLLVTHVWFVTERVLTYKSPIYQQWGNTQSWPRMISRALLLAACFLGWNLWALLVFCFGLIYHWLDLTGKFHMRAIIIDIFVVLFIALGLNVI